MEVGVQCHAPANLPPERTPLHVDGGLGGPYIRSERFRRMENLLPLPRFVHRLTVQLVAWWLYNCAVQASTATVTRQQPGRRIKADSHISRRAHAVPLPCVPLRV